MRAFAAGAVLAGLALPLLLAADSGAESKRGFLEVISQGYSRFEIEDGNVVAYYPEPVTFLYLGYEVHADTLRFNQATSVAEASGNITLQSKDLRLECSAVLLDGEAGLAKASGGIAGQSGSLGVSFCSAEASLAFPAGQYNPDLADISIEVSGGVSVADSKGSVVQADSATLDGASRVLSVPGQVRAALAIEKHAAQSGFAINSDQQMQLSCRDVSAKLTETEGIDSVSATDVIAVTTEIQLNAPAVSFSQQEKDTDANPVWLVQASGSPLRVTVRQKEQSFHATGSAAELTFGSTGISEAILSGSAVAWSGSSTIRSERIVLSPTKEGLRASADKGLIVSSDMAAASGMQPINLQSQLQHRSK